jgi:hypothetical protein
MAFMAAPVCSICQSANVAAIDAALAAGAKLVPTAQQFGVGKSSLGRHRNKCLAPKVAAAARMLQPAKETRRPVERARELAAGAAPTVNELLNLEGLLGKLARSLDRLEAAADEAADTGLHGALAALSGQIHRGIESVAKLKGFYTEASLVERPAASINIVFPAETQRAAVVIDASVPPDRPPPPALTPPVNWNMPAVDFTFDEPVN